MYLFMSKLRRIKCLPSRQKNTSLVRVASLSLSTYCQIYAHAEPTQEQTKTNTT